MQEQILTHEDTDMNLNLKNVSVSKNIIYWKKSNYTKQEIKTWQNMI
jgi:hypothetical protein